MKVLKFRLWGENAFFKKPDVNTYLYFTYSNIHKIALLGMLGAIVGYKGYNQMSRKNDEAKSKNLKEDFIAYPEFYEKLKDILVAIEPEEGSRGDFPKKVQIFNNSVGYASQEQGGNLIIKEQWLEKPSWNIYVLVDSKDTEKICDYITNCKSVFIPYLGKNDHMANIDEIEIYEVEKADDEIEAIDSLCPKSYVNFGDMVADMNYKPYKYKENLPIRLNEKTNMYEYETFIYTNMEIEDINTDKIYTVGNKNIAFF